jgi:hypothetical protein
MFRTIRRFPASIRQRDRIVLLALHEGVVRADQDEDFRFDGSRRRCGVLRLSDARKPATAARSAPARAMFSTTAPPKQ